MQLQKKWHEGYERIRVSAQDLEEVQAQAAKLHEEGWRQTSRKWRHISKEGRTLVLDSRAEPFMRELRKLSEWRFLSQGV